MILISPLLQGFSSGETDFYFYQFLSNFFKYSFSNFLSFYLYNIFAMYFPGNSLLLKSLFFTISIFSCCLTSAFILSLNSATISFIFFRSFLFSHESCSTVNLFHCTKYFTTPLTFLLFSIFYLLLFNFFHFYQFYFFYLLFFYLFSILYYLTDFYHQVNSH